MDIAHYILGFLQGGLRVLEVVLIFSILVISHEFGHFLMAKAAGMRVDEFAIGFGKRLFSWQRGETLYTVNMFPIGGYNKIYGMDIEDPEDESIESDELSDNVKTTKEPAAPKAAPPDYSIAPADDPRAFVNHPLYKRFGVVIAGPVANIIVAIIVIFLMGITIGFPATELGVVIPGGPADGAGLMPGDIITRLNGVRLSSRSDLHRAVMFSNGRSLNLEGWRGYEEFVTDVIPQPTRLVDSYFCRIGFIYMNDGTILHVLQDSPAERSGLEPGDMIIEVGGIRFPSHRLEIESGCGILPLTIYSGYQPVNVDIEYFESEIRADSYSPFGFFYDDEQVITGIITYVIADESGLEVGDIIVGGITETWTQTIPGESAQSPKPTVLEYERNGKIHRARLEPDMIYSQILVRWDDATLPVLSNLPFDHRLSHAGLRSGDEILSVEGYPTPNGISAMIEFERNLGASVDIVGLSGGEERVFIVALPNESDRDGMHDFFGGIHFKTRYFATDAKSSLISGVRKSQEITGFIFMTIGWLFSGKASIDDLAGPVGIVNITYKAATSGLVDLINIMVLLSINLAIFNLLPFPALDGGRLIFMFLEAIFRRPVVTVKIENIIHIAGFLLLILFALLITYNDITRMIFGR